MLDRKQEKELVAQVAVKLRSFTLRQLFRVSGQQYFGIPLELTDAEAIRVFRKAMKAVEGEI